MKQLTKEQVEKKWDKVKNKRLFLERYQLPEEMLEGDNKILSWLESEYDGKDSIWYFAQEYKGLSEEFLRKAISKFHLGNSVWSKISMHNSLSESFIEEYHEKLSWLGICANQNLSEMFIEKWHDKVYWTYIAEYQNLTRDFILKNFNRLEISCLLRNKKLNNELKEELKVIQNMTCSRFY